MRPRPRWSLVWLNAGVMAQNAILLALALGYGQPVAAAISGSAMLVSAGTILYVWPEGGR